MKSKESLKAMLSLLLTVALFIGVAIGGWKVTRWLNWKLSYGPKVEERLAKIEARLDALEARESSEGQE